MSVEGKKLKAYIGKLKECLDNHHDKDSPMDTPATLRTHLPFLYRLVLAAELCQRGVILPMEAIQCEDGNHSKLFDAITNAAGKEMLNANSSSLKPPLIAGAAIISAMAADKLASASLQVHAAMVNKEYAHEHKHEYEHSLLTPHDANMEEIKSMVKNSLQRCRDVGDDRLHLLLTLALRQETEGCASTSSNKGREGATATSMALTKVEEMILLLQRMAFGNCLRATQFTNPDQPPMYKRSLDACLTYQKTARRLLLQKNASADENENENENDDYDMYETLDAIVPLKNLIRIAQSKQNVKRVSELSLRICQSYIAACECASTGTSANDATTGTAKTESQLLNDDGLKLWDKVNDAFGVHVVSPKEGDDSDAKKKKKQDSQNITKAQESLMQFNEEVISDTDASGNDGNIDSLLLLYKLMKVRVGFAFEDVLVNHMKEDRYVASRNRSGTGTGLGIGGGGGKSTTREAFTEEVRRELVTGTLPTEEAEFAMDYDGDELNSACDTLRDAFVSLQQQQQHLSTLTIPSSLLRDVCLYTQKQVDRCILRAQSIALQNLKKKKKKKGNDDGSDAIVDAWRAVWMFVDPMLDSIQKCKDDNGDENDVLMIKMVESMPLSQRTLMNTISEAILMTVWMTVKCPEVQVPVVYMRTATEFLTANQAILVNIEKTQEKELLEKEGKVVRTNSSSGPNRKRVEMETALSVGTCFNLLSSLGAQNDLTSLQLNQMSIISNETIKATKAPSQSKLVSDLNAKFGLPFIRFLSCWSGLHGSAWNFCNVSQARSIVQYAQESVLHAEKTWGRKMSDLERILLQLGEADAECGFLQGGFTPRAKALYEQVLEKLPSDDKSSDHLNCLLKAHCRSCLAKISLKVETMGDFESVCLEAAQQAKLSMEGLQTTVGELPEVSYFHIWRTDHALHASFEYHISFSRQLVAEAFLGASKHLDAQIFLKDAVKASPKNYDVAFAYGSFCLRVALYITDEGLDNASYRKKAQSQLVKAAKLNTERADPFALLGIWYEVQKDLKRAAGCYSKALLIDPSHPVAGRGILRLKPSKEVLLLCNTATNLGTFQNGWAWQSLGDTKALVDGNDEKAILCYQQALRCHDIENPRQHRLGIFFQLPSSEIIRENQECSDTWASLGGCYRRLGKFSASLRAFQFAHDIAPGDLSYYCSWAQVELELGLLDESTEKFEIALNDERTNNRYSAAYGLASCMLLAARRKTEEGKYGDALSCLEKGVKSIESMLQDDNERSFFCAWKTLGDLYSHGSILPPSVFRDNQNIDSVGAMQKLKFIEKGEEAYKHIVTLVGNGEPSENTSDSHSLLTTAFSDIAINVFLRARIRGEMLHEGSGVGCTNMIDISKDEEISRLTDLSIQYFTKAIESNESVPLPWCGLGCALVSRDPILAQHAFCRALQLDKASEDAWANLSLLHLNYDKVDSSEESVDALTQVADTPLMWIARGLLLEKNARENGDSDGSLYKAADAYRASLQITRHEAALLGLSLTCRRLGCNGPSRDEYAREANRVSFKESDANLRMFLDSSGGKHLGAKALSGVYDHDKGNRLSVYELQELARDFFAQGSKAIGTAHKHLDDLSGDGGGEELKDAMNILNSCETITKSLRGAKTKNNRKEAINRSQKISQARHGVIQDPGNGYLWLQFSKELLKALSSDYSEEGCRIVSAAIDKTKQILVSDGIVSPILHPTPRSSRFAQRNIQSKPIEASVLSEIMSLSHWVKDLSSENKGDTRDLQRSAILDPSNRFARANISIFTP